MCADGGRGGRRGGRPRMLPRMHGWRPRRRGGRRGRRGGADHGCCHGCTGGGRRGAGGRPRMRATDARMAAAAARGGRRGRRGGADHGCCHGCTDGGRRGAGGRPRMRATDARMAATAARWPARQARRGRPRMLPRTHGWRPRAWPWTCARRCAARATRPRPPTVPGSLYSPTCENLPRRTSGARASRAATFQDPCSVGRTRTSLSATRRGRVTV